MIKITSNTYFQFPINGIVPVATMTVYLGVTFKVAKKRAKFNQQFSKSPIHKGCFGGIQIPKSAANYAAIVVRKFQFSN